MRLCHPAQEIVQLHYCKESIENLYEMNEQLKVVSSSYSLNSVESSMKFDQPLMKDFHAKISFLNDTTNPSSPVNDVTNVNISFEKKKTHGDD